MRAKPWTALQSIALQSGWDARITHAHDIEWCSVALRARDSMGRRVIGLWRGRDMEHMRFTSAMFWIERWALHEDRIEGRIDGQLLSLTAAELRGVLRGP